MTNRVTPFQRPPPAPHMEAPARGALMILVGCAALTVNDACMKALVSVHSVGQIVSMRAALGLIMLLVLSPFLGGVRALRPRNPAGASILTALLIVGLFLFPWSLQFIPLADAIMLAYLSPAIVAMVSPFVLREKVGWRRWSAVAMGLAGAALVIRPAGEGFQIAMLVPVIVAVSVAIRDLLTRRFVRGENTLALVAAAHLGAAVIGLVSLTAGWSALTATEWALLIVAAAMLTLAQILMVGAFRYAEATVLSCLKYSSIIWAAAFGWMFFGEVPGLHDWIGAALIAVSGVIIMLREKRAETAGVKPD